MAMRAKHAFGNLADIDAALQAGKIDAFDILFLDGDTSPKIGWIDGNGVFRLVENEADFSELEAVIATKANASDVEALETEVALKASAEDVEAIESQLEAAMAEHLIKKYEITGLPAGCLVDYGEKEIRVLCPEDSAWVKQAVGSGGNSNRYYMMFKTFAPDENAVGYIEHIGDQADTEILTDLKTDGHGRRYQPTWLSVAEYDEEFDTWTYLGVSSTESEYYGYDYQIDWYDADGVMIHSDSIRVNLANEDCYSSIRPYYIGEMMAEVETIIEDKIAAIDAAYTIVEF